MQHDFVVTIPIRPKGKDRPRHGPGGVDEDGKEKRVTYTTTATRQWEARMAIAVQEKIGSVLLQPPIRLDILMVVARPQYMCFQYKATGEYKFPTGLVWCDKRPDRDNVEKNVMDALKTFWADDSQVVSGEVLKAFAEIGHGPRVIVRIRTETRHPKDVAESLGLIVP